MRTILLIILFFFNFLFCIAQQGIILRNNYFLHKQYKYERIREISNLIINKNGTKYFRLINGNRLTEIDSLIYKRQFFELTHKIVDTLGIDTIACYFPESEYLTSNSDFYDTLQLFIYSRILKTFNEPVYKEKMNKVFFRFLIINQNNIALYRIEQKNFNDSCIIIYKTCDGNYDSMTNLKVDSCKLNYETYMNFYNKIMATDIWIIKPHNARYFSYSDTGITVFESNANSYQFVDIFDLLSKQSKILKSYYKALKFFEKEMLSNLK